MNKRINIFNTAIIFAVISALVSIGMMFGYKYIVAPKYTSTAQLIVNKVDKDNDARLTDMQADIQMIATYSDVIKSPYILEKVSNQLQTDESISQLQNKIFINANKDSQVFSINVTDTSPKKAQVTNQILTNVFYTNVSQILKIKNITVLSAPNLPQSSTGVTQFQFVIASFVVTYFLLIVVTAIYLYLPKKELKNAGDE